MSNVYPFSPTQMAERVDPDSKRFSTCRARVALLLGGALRRHVADDGTVVFAIGLRRFVSLDQVEDFLDQIGGDE